MFRFNPMYVIYWFLAAILLALWAITVYGGTAEASGAMYSAMLFFTVMVALDITVISRYRP